MIYPTPSDTAETWNRWLELVAPLGGPCNNELPTDMRYLAKIPDRELAVLSARGIVNTLRMKREIR